ncbi:DUF6707 family protein [Algibacter lectus]|nr:DUF6707 family protein [Algibacter lectus]
MYTIGKKRECVDFYEYYKDLQPVKDKRVWTWIESSLLLFSLIFNELNEKDNSENCIEIVKEAFTLGNDLVVSVNNKARERRMNGELLSTEKVDISIQQKESDDELTYRIILLKELIYIKALSYSDNMTKEKVNKAIDANILALKNLL